MPHIDPHTVLALARAQGQHWIDAAAAERIAAGAAAAIASVEATLRSVERGLLAGDGAAFLEVLESLADAPR
jgi:hypothetical protein